MLLSLSLSSPLSFRGGFRWPPGALFERRWRSRGVRAHLSPISLSGACVAGMPVMGGTLTAAGEFVGTPSVQWYRKRADAPLSAIAGACSLSYGMTADDVGCSLRVRRPPPDLVSPASRPEGDLS